ncbi:MAG: WXG100 family type VII secretion target [Lawsonibacter sp.]|jgi:WXG100 family type VII secretion target|nr:WXG100 family type VII secretion target [Lawsonibacter sp.]
MAQGKIIVETSRLDSTASQVDRLADQYESEYNALFGTVKDLQNAWSGEDNVAFTSQIEGFRDDFQRMTRLMRDYADYLRKVAESYRSTQDNVAAKAKTLSQGS